MTGLIDFSSDAASNDLAAPPILWIEGQPAKTVNNSMREVMAALARWRDDNAGALLATRGAGDAYTVSTGQIFNAASAARAHTLSFNVSALNEGPATLSLDGQAALPLRRPGNIELGPRDLRPGIVYRVVRSTTAPVYLIVAPTFAECGTVSAFASPAVPEGWLICDGRSLSRTAYAALFLLIGTSHGAENDSTFRIPDLRGRTIFGLDSGAGRLTGAGGLGGDLGNVGGSQTVTLTEAQLAPHGHGGSTGNAGGHDHGGSVVASGQHSHGGGTGAAGAHSHTGATSAAGAHSHTGTTEVGGAHIHPIGYNRVSIYQTGGSGVAVASIYPGVVNAGGATDSEGTSSGQHQHSLTTSGVGDHAHSLTTDSVGDHAHSIALDGQHAHGIPAVGDHAHSLTISAAGGGQGHPNVPPGLVLTLAIKA
ncbi:tail fiber protein [Methylobacterium gossipiicola]|uniref:Microcystin-dependent protein n=1 Tax=Methylobacterium gossipiicola TaxID=582675 RepID=A0A1I2TIM3_9HYPH|nr:tail fiber protein [Methylobacterium gossipiicola]SFG64774.1 Microcystin-dependent protein [Methylobacterium gossipiicola]